MDMRTVASYLGSVLEVIGIMALVPVFVSWAYGDGMHAGFFVAAILSFFSGVFLDRRFVKEDLSTSSSMVIAALSFLVLSAIGSIPYMFYMDPMDSWFESVSGFTTTGLTVVEPESLPQSLLFWRSMTQWIGGAGIILIFIMLVGSPGMSSYYLYKGEPGMEFGIKKTVRKVMTIYSSYTALGIALFALAGMPVYEALLNSLTAISTGGFSTRNGSIGAFGSPGIEAAAIVLMILGSTSFFVHAKLWKLRFREYLSNPETRLFWAVIAAFSTLMAISYLGSGEPLRQGIFNTVSAVSGTGFSVGGISLGTTKILLIILMIMGGYAGSASGGLKMIRSGLILRALPWMGKKISLPQEAVVPFKFGGRVFKEAEISIIALFACIYLVILGASALSMTFMGYAPLDSVFMSASAEGTAGLSVVPVDGMNPAGKLLLTSIMLLGRLEIIPFMVLIYVLMSGSLKSLASVKIPRGKGGSESGQAEAKGD